MTKAAATLISIFKSRIAAMIASAMLPPDSDFVSAVSVHENALRHLDEELQRLNLVQEAGNDKIRLIKADVQTLRIGVNSLIFGALSVPVTRPANIRRKIELALQKNIDLAVLFPILADLKRLEAITS